MAIGMTYQEYWYGIPGLTKVYYEAHIYRNRMENERLWLQGAYNYNAFSSVINQFAYGLNGKKGSKPQGYLTKPLDMGEKTEGEKKKTADEERARAIASLNRWKAAWEQRYGNS